MESKSSWRVFNNNYFDADRPFYYVIVTDHDNTLTNQMFSGRFVGLNWYFLFSR